VEEVPGEIVPARKRNTENPVGKWGERGNGKESDMSLGLPAETPKHKGGVYVGSVRTTLK